MIFAHRMFFILAQFTQFMLGNVIIGTIFFKIESAGNAATLIYLFSDILKKRLYAREWFCCNSSFSNS